MVSDLEQVHEREYLIYGPSVKEQLMYKKMCIYALSITQKLSIESKHFKMIECLSEIGIDDKDLQNNKQTILGTVSVCKNRKWNDI